MSAAKSPKLVRLPKTMLPTLREYAAAKEAKREAEAAARAADNVMKSLQALIVAAMEGQVTAVCESAVVTLSETAAAAASLTMVDGSKTPWDRVTAVLVGNIQVPRDQVATIYGGRSGSVRLDVKGA
jgi:hypothetical protein